MGRSKKSEWRYVRRSMASAIPEKKIVGMEWCRQNSETFLDQATMQEFFTFEANNIYTPEGGVATKDAPWGYDYLIGPQGGTGMYRLWRVLKCEWQMDMHMDVDAGFDKVICCALDTNNNKILGQSTEHVVENPYVYSRILYAPGGTGSRAGKIHMSGKLNVEKQLNLHDGAGINGLKKTVDGGVPNPLLRMQFYYANFPGNSGASVVYWTCRLKFLVEFSNPNDLPTEEP